MSPFAVYDLCFRLSLILLPMLLYYPADGGLHLRRLLLEVSSRSAPLLRRVGWQFAPIDGKHLFADQSQVVTYQYHITEKVNDLLIIKSAMVVKCGLVSALKAMKMMFSSQAWAILLLETIPRE